MHNSPPGSSLRERLVRRLLLGLIFIGIIGLFGAYGLGSKYANLAYDQALFDDVSTLAGQVGLDEDGRLQVSLPSAALTWLLADEGEMVRYRITDMRTRSVVASNGNLGPMPEDALSNGQAAYRDFIDAGRVLRVAYTYRMLEAGKVPVLIEIGETIGKRDRVKRNVLMAMLLFITTIVAVAIGLVWQGVTSALLPLKRIEAEVALRSASDLQPLEPMDAPEELRGLLTSVNRLMMRVSSSIDSQRHFIANAAHQLRTPMAGLRLQAQLASKGDNPEAVRACLSEVEASAERAAHLIDQLLLLSRAEAPDSLDDHERADLVRVAHQVIGRFLTIADQRQVDLGFDGDMAVPAIAGNEILLGELLANLVDNALRYGRRYGRVTVGVRRDGASVLLSVSDDGDGFAEEDRARVFQRFYRPDSSQGSGAGLGLAIVHEIAQRYFGVLELQSSPGKGSRFELRFPVADMQPVR